MPKISLVVCVCREYALLERLLRETEGCYDDLVVIHDGPEYSESETGTKMPLDAGCVPSHCFPDMAVDYALPEEASAAHGFWNEPLSPREGSIHALVTRYGGRFYEGNRCWQQEPHWPFAWSKARHDWILRLDADEFPSKDLKEWLKDFRNKETVADSGFLCIWPLWNGRRETFTSGPPNRVFLFNRNRVSFFGMVEHVPTGDVPFTPVCSLLHHQPYRKSYGLKNIIFRRQAWRWKWVILRSLARTPLSLPRWRYSSCSWPPNWTRIRQRPLRSAAYTLVLIPIRDCLYQLRQYKRVDIDATFGTVFHSASLPLLISVFRHLLKYDKDKTT